MLVRFVFSDWVNDNEESVYTKEKGVDLAAGSFHSGTTFLGDLYLSYDNEVELRQALAEGYYPVFTVFDEAIERQQVAAIKDLIKRLRNPDVILPNGMKEELESGNVSIMADVLEKALEVK